MGKHLIISSSVTYSTEMKLLLKFLEGVGIDIFPKQQINLTPRYRKGIRTKPDTLFEEIGLEDSTKSVVIEGKDSRGVPREIFLVPSIWLKKLIGHARVKEEKRKALENTLTKTLTELERVSKERESLEGMYNHANEELQKQRNLNTTYGKYVVGLRSKMYDTLKDVTNANKIIDKIGSFTPELSNILSGLRAKAADALKNYETQSEEVAEIKSGEEETKRKLKKYLGDLMTSRETHFDAREEVFRQSGQNLEEVEEVAAKSQERIGEMLKYSEELGEILSRLEGLPGEIEQLTTDHLAAKPKNQNSKDQKS